MNSSNILKAFDNLPPEGIVAEDLNSITYTSSNIIAEYTRGSDILYIRKRNINGYEALISTVYLNNVNDNTMVSYILCTVLNACHLIV